LHKRLTIATALFGLSLLLAGGSRAGGKDLLLLLPGFPGSAVQAQPFVDRVLRYVEGKLSWPTLSMSGLYVPDGGAAARMLENKKPGIALVGPSVYCSEHKSLGMKVIAKVEVDGRASEKYSVVTLETGPAGLAELVGKRVEGAVLEDAKYVHNVLLDRQVPLGQLELKSEKRPLKALRNLARGKADAAIVDESVLAHMSELPFGGDLRVIYTSKPVPAPAVVVLGEGKAHAKALKGVLVGMCKRPDGKELCKTLTLTSIKAASDKDYAKLVKAYDR
jgi:hypothetical protein